VELANLYWHVAKNPWYACSAVQNDCRELESSRFNTGAQERVVFLRLRRYPFPAQVRLEVRLSGREQGVFADMRGIENADDCLRRDRRALSNLRLIDSFPNPILAFAVSSSEVLDRLPLPDMLSPNLVGELLRPALVLKLFAAIWTAVVLNPSSFSILPYARIFTVRTLFLRMVCS